MCFKGLIKEKFSTFTGQQGNKTFQLTTEEANALRYAAGYVCHKLIKKLEMSSTDRRFELISLLTNLTGGEGDGTAEDWTNLLDRGGLCHINEDTYMFFVAMEEEVQLNLQALQVKTIGQDNLKKKLLDSIAANENVLYYWSLLTEDVNDNDATKAFSMISNLWVTIRKLTFVSAWMELHKQALQKGLQKSQALRKTLN